jgi:hypothetical protein
MVASSFVCVVILPLYFQLMFVTSSRTVGMPRSACSSPFWTYHGALTIARSTLFWNLCNISILDVLADPHSGNVILKLDKNKVLVWFHLQAHEAPL